MGKKNFKETHYAAACSKLNSGSAPSLKISYYSDEYKAGCNFAIVIMYSWKGEFTWFNSHKGHKGRFLYVAFQNTSEWPAEQFEAAGAGRVHNFIYKDTFGEEWTENTASCGGAGIKDGMLKFSSLWLNLTNSNKPHNASYTQKWESDGAKYLSDGERALVKFATKMWMQHGKHKIYTIPSDLHNCLMGYSDGEEIPKEGVSLQSL